LPSNFLEEVPEHRSGSDEEVPREIVEFAESSDEVTVGNVGAVGLFKYPVRQVRGQPPSATRTFA
jgi:hypothetical protein